MKAVGSLQIIAITARQRVAALEAVSDTELRGTFAGVDDTVDLRAAASGRVPSTRCPVATSASALRVAAAVHGFGDARRSPSSSCA